MDNYDDDIEDVLCEALRLIRKCREGETGPSKRTKVSIIPDSKHSFVDDEDNALKEVVDYEVEDTITDATIEDFLK